MKDEELCRCIRLFHKTVYRAAYSYLRNAEESEDVCQDAFLKLYSSEEVFDSDENCKAWLIRVAVNLSKNVLRSYRFSRVSELDESVPYTSRSERELMDGIAALPPKYRIVIHLHYFEGYNLREIGEILRISESGAASRLSRARAKLKKILSDDEEEVLLKEGRV